MSHSAKTPSRFIVVLKLPEYEVPLLLVQARAIVERMTGNSWFPSPTPSLAVVQAAIDDLSEAETTTLTRLKGSAAARDEKRRALVVRLQHLASYVQVIADANPEHAASIIESAGMYVKDPGGRSANVFGVKPGDVPGEAKLTAPFAGDRAIYEFQFSVDGKATWIALEPEKKASATVRGLTRGTTVYFRYRVKVKDVAGDWSDPIAFIVE